MSHNPNDSAIRVDAALEEKLKGASFEEIKAHLANAAVEQRLVVPDVYDHSVLIPTELAGAAPKKVGKVVVLNGVKHSLVAEDEAGLLAQENALYKQAMQPAATETRTEQPRNERGQFTTQQVATDNEKAALSLQLQLGQIDIATFLERSGAVADYLEKAGVPIEHLRESVQEKQADRVMSSWKSATDEFLAGSGNWWPGGDINMEKMGKVLIEMGAEDSPSAENLRRAAEYLRDSNQLVEPPEVAARNRALEAERIINETNDPYALRNMLQPGTSLFGR